MVLAAALTGWLTKLDLVTREEFDVQSELLARSRARLTQLEATGGPDRDPRAVRGEARGAERFPATEILGRDVRLLAGTQGRRARAPQLDLRDDEP